MLAFLLNTRDSRFTAICKSYNDIVCASNANIFLFFILFHFSFQRFWVIMLLIEYYWMPLAVELG